jgi:hypothetical protein
VPTVINLLESFRVCTGLYRNCFFILNNLSWNARIQDSTLNLLPGKLPGPEIIPRRLETLPKLYTCL